jgi:hypothetical protein
VRHPADASRVQDVLHEVLGDECRTARDIAYLHADVCRSDLLVEIEAHAFAPGRLRLK